METKVFDRVELKATPAGEFHALVSTFDQPDRYGDITRRGAFTETIASWRSRDAKLPVVFSHRAEDPMQHIGEIDPVHGLVETPTGLHAKGHFYLEEPIAKKVFLQLQRKALSQWSFAYAVHKAKPLPTGGRELLQIEVFEIGPTLVGVGHTATLDVKAATRETAGSGPLAAPYARLDRALRRLAIDVAAAR